MGYFSNVRLHIRLPSFLASLLTREIERHHGNISTWRLVTIRPPCSKHLFEDYQLFIHISFQPNSWYTRYWPFKLPEGGNKNVPKPWKIWKKEVLTFIMNQMISNGIWNKWEQTNFHRLRPDVIGSLKNYTNDYLFQFQERSFDHLLSIDNNTGTV